MIVQLMKLRRRRVLIDISTQMDFFTADGKACIRNHRRVLANVRRMMAWARKNHTTIISTCQIYPDNNGSSMPDYCLDGTDGQKKLSYTTVGNFTSFQADGSADIPRDVFCHYQQVILHQRSTDPFQEPRIERLLSEIKAAEFVIIGACAEDAVEATALGLLQRDKNVTIVVDAVGMHDRQKADLAIRKMKAKGAKLIETKKLAGATHLKMIGACNCPACCGKKAVVTSV